MRRIRQKPTAFSRRKSCATGVTNTSSRNCRTADLASLHEGYSLAFHLCSSLLAPQRLVQAKPPRNAQAKKSEFVANSHLRKRRPLATLLVLILSLNSIWIAGDI